MTRILAAAALAATMAAFSSGAQAQSFEWQGQNRNWTPPSRNVCVLELNRIYQPNPGQPIHLVITNRSTFRVQYTVNITLRRGREVTSGQIFVDNANPGERSERPSIQPFAGSLAGSTVTLTVPSCSRRS
jgi:hypothetical protein